MASSGPPSHLGVVKQKRKRKDGAGKRKDSEEGSKKKRHSKFVDAREELPGSPDAVPADSATRTTAASPLQPPLPPPPPAVAASAAQAPPSSRPGVHVDIVILPSPPGSGRAAGGGRRAGGEEGRQGNARKSKKRERKTLTTKGKQRVMLKAVAQAEQAQQQQQQQAEQAQPDAQPQQQQQEQQQQEEQAGPVAGPPAAAALAGAAPAPSPTCNLGKAWSKADITTLTRLATDRAFLLASIPTHPPQGELNWDLISQHLGRHSPGGRAVQAQYRLVLRTMKEARGEGRRGANYADLVCQVLLELPGRRGTVLEIQKVLKQRHSSCLDKYKDASGAMRWKKAVGEALRSEGALFEQVDKTATGKIVWQLKAHN